jgi:hypothetical protein
VSKRKEGGLSRKGKRLVLLQCGAWLNFVSLLRQHLVFIQYMYIYSFTVSTAHRLNIELDLKSFFGLLFTAVLLAETPPPIPFPSHLGSFTRALLVSQDRRHFFVNPKKPKKAEGALFETTFRQPVDIWNKS